MFREMRRKKQQLTTEECVEILKQEPRGILSMLGDDGYPYGIPMTHWYCEENGHLYFHGAKEGHKIDAIEKCDKVSFCVIDQDIIIPKEYTTYFRSVIVFGRARILRDEKEKQKAFEILAAKYSPNDQEGRLAEIHKLFKQTVIFVLDIEYMSGKESIELKNKT